MTADRREAAALEIVRNRERRAVLESVDLLDTPAEEAFDRITRLAHRLLDVPTVLFNLVAGERSFLKSAFGVPDALRGTLERPLELCFCQHVIAAGGALVLEDAGADPFFARNPAAIELAIRGFLGVPLIVRGQAIGALNMLDTRPRRWSEEDVRVARDLASAAAAEIELRLALRERSETERLERERARALALSAAVAVALTEARTLREQLTRSAQAIVDHLGAAFARIWTHDEANAVLELQASAGLYTHLDGPHGRVPVGSLKVGRIAADRAPHLTNSVQTDPRVSDHEWAIREGMVAFAGYPVVAEDRLLGVVALFSKRPLERATLEALHSVANTIALGIARTRFAEDVASREAHFRALIEKSRDGIILIDADGRYVDASPSVTRILGYARDELLGRPFTDFLHPDEIEALGREWQGILSQPGASADMQIRFRHKNGTWRWMEATDTNLLDDPRVHAVIANFRDVTERRAMEADRERMLERERSARAEALAANRAKDDFLAILSHELRSPLSAVINWAHMLKRSALGPAETARAIDAIERNSHQQARLIDDLLDISRIVSGKLHLEFATTDFADLAEQAVASCRAYAAAKRIRVEIDRDPNPVTVRADATRLHQVVGNLLSNAIKFTPEGGHVAVSLRRYASLATLTVSDDGAGIAPAMLEKIFDRFQQADSSMTRAHGGLGLGLSIARHLVVLHGGEISAASDGEGNGATFCVTLPIARSFEPFVPSRRAESLDSDRSLSGVRVLVVDDEADAREFVATLLSRAGAAVDAASSVAEALERVACERPGVVVTDLAMPVEDGFSLLRGLRQTERAGEPRLHVIALTALAGPIDRERVAQAGFDLHLTKPVDAGDLIAAVARAAAGRASDFRPREGSLPPGR